MSKPEDTIERGAAFRAASFRATVMNTLQAGWSQQAANVAVNLKLQVEELLAEAFSKVMAQGGDYLERAARDLILVTAPPPEAAPLTAAQITEVVRTVYTETMEELRKVGFGTALEHPTFGIDWPIIGGGGTAPNTALSQGASDVPEPVLARLRRTVSIVWTMIPDRGWEPESRPEVGRVVLIAIDLPAEVLVREARFYNDNDNPWGYHWITPNGAVIVPPRVIAWAPMPPGPTRKPD